MTRDSKPEDAPACINCGKLGAGTDNTWQPDEVCLFGMLFACSVSCAETWAAANAAPGFRPGEPGFCPTPSSAAPSTAGT